MPDGDPLTAHDLAVLAWEAYTRNHLGDAARLASRASGAAVPCPPRDRQVVEVVCLAIAGESERASGLAAVHLGEFPHIVRDSGMPKMTVYNADSIEIRARAFWNYLQKMPGAFGVLSIV